MNELPDPPVLQAESLRLSGLIYSVLSLAHSVPAFIILIAPVYRNLIARVTLPLRI